MDKYISEALLCITYVYTCINIVDISCVLGFVIYHQGMGCTFPINVVALSIQTHRMHKNKVYFFTLRQVFPYLLS